MRDAQKPVARSKNLVIQELPGEVLVYDLATNKAHCLNQTAAIIWKSCDGTSSVGDISRRLSDLNGDAVSADLVWLAINQLSENDLLEKGFTADYGSHSRRAVIKKIGLTAAVALPLVTSLIAPKAVQAGSACSGACTCNAGTAINNSNQNGTGTCPSSNCQSGCTIGCQGMTGDTNGICS